MRAEGSLLTAEQVTFHGGKGDANTFLLSLLVTLVGLFSFGCGGPAPSGDGQPGSSTEVPELTNEIIYERINDAWLREVPEETGTAKPISWNFDEDEPKEIVVVDKQMKGTHATIVLDIKTRSSPRARANRQLSGQIKTEWVLSTSWVLRRWKIVGTENISMKYKDLPASNAANSNRESGAPNPPPGP
jgi:hypothetical protein